MRSTPAAARTSTNSSATFFATPEPLSRILNFSNGYCGGQCPHTSSTQASSVVLSCRCRTGTGDAPCLSRREAVMVVRNDPGTSCDDCRSNESTMKKYNCPSSYYNQAIPRVFAEA